MTQHDQARRAFSPPRGRRRPDQDRRGYDDVSTLSDKLIAAREAKGVDLLRAERETKIRRAYLAALESGDYQQLPSGVYARGFIRNYATYLGLDPEKCVALYMRETAGFVTSEPVLPGPRGVEAPRRPFVIPPGLIAAGLAAVAAIVILAYIAFQLVRFAEPPSLVVTDPSEGVTTVKEKTTSYTLRGTTIPGGIITIQATGRDSTEVVADGDGIWAKAVELRNGKNQFEISARDPRTQNTANEAKTLIITVPLSAALAPTLTVASPASDATFKDGAIPVTGSAGNAAAVSVAARYEGPLEGRDPPRATPAAPKAIKADLADDGTFEASLDLPAGRWAVSVTATSEAGKTTIVTRSVSVDYQGVILVTSISGGRAWMKVWVDGKVSSQTGNAGKTYKDGDTLTFRAARTIEVWTGNPSVTRFTLNGRSLGVLSTSSDPATWLFDPPSAPKKTNRRE